MSWWPGWESIAGSDWWSNFFFWLSIAGLCVLGASEVASHRYTLRKDELVTAEQKEADRQHQAELARLGLETAQANERAAAANQKAEEERKARVELEARLAWRALSPEQRGNIVSKIRPYAGQRYVASVAADPESVNFLGILDGVLKEAGWVKLPPIGVVILEQQQASVALKMRVAVQCAPSAEATLGPVVVAVADALRAEGVDAYPARNAEMEPHAAAIAIIVGSKPQ